MVTDLEESHHILILFSTDQFTLPLIVYLGSLKRREFLTLKSRSHKTAHSPLYTWLCVCKPGIARLGWRAQSRSRFLIVCRVIPTIMLFFPGLLTIPTCHIIIPRYSSSHWSSGCQNGLWLVRVYGHVIWSGPQSVCHDVTKRHTSHPGTEFVGFFRLSSQRWRSLSTLSSLLLSCFFHS